MGLGGVLELERSEHIAVVGQCDRFLAVPHGLVHHLADVGGSVEQGVLGVAMKVAEVGHGWLTFLRR